MTKRTTWLTISQVHKLIGGRRGSILTRIRQGRQPAKMNEFGLWMIRSDRITRPLPTGRPRKPKLKAGRG